MAAAMKNLTASEKLFAALRQVQRRTNCSDSTCNAFVKAFANFSDVPVEGSLKQFDAKAKKFAGSDYFVLHGCPKCDEYIYTPADRNVTCPHMMLDGTVCGKSRLNEMGQAHEVCFGLICLSFISHIKKFDSFLFPVCRECSTSRSSRGSEP